MKCQKAEKGGAYREELGSVVTWPRVYLCSLYSSSARYIFHFPNCPNVTQKLVALVYCSYFYGII